MTKLLTTQQIQNATDEELSELTKHIAEEYIKRAILIHTKTMNTLRCIHCGDILRDDEYRICESCKCGLQIEWDQEETRDRITEGGYGSG